MKQLSRSTKRTRLKNLNNKPYKCTECDYSATAKSTLNAHRRKHMKKPFKCSLCEHSATSEKTLRIHVAACHHNKTERVPCSWTFIVICRLSFQPSLKTVIELYFRMKFGCGRNIESPQRSIGYTHFKPKRTPNPSFPCPSQKHNSFNIYFLGLILIQQFVYVTALIMY